MLDVELAKPLPAVSSAGQYKRLFILGRLHTEPIGVCVAHIGLEGLTPNELGALLWPEFRDPVTRRFAAAGLPAPYSLTGCGLEADETIWPFLQHRSAVLAAAPFISVVICTRDRPDRLETCLDALEGQEYPRFEIVVVDNAPSSSAVQALVKSYPSRSRLRYVLEPFPGLSWARNKGIAIASGEIIAFLDDDEEPDSHWLAGLVGGFARGEDIGCVSGMVLPARLDTQAQELFEQLGGHCKGRGFTSAQFSRHGPQSPLYPIPPFGVGANMAFRREALACIGGFDVALGAGTPTFAGEDTLALTLILLSGYRIAYEPAALMRHHHREDLDSLINQLRGYAVGLTAYYSALLRHRPGLITGLIGLLPSAVKYVRCAKVTPAMGAQDLLAGLTQRRRKWMLAGPGAYVRSLLKQARVSNSRKADSVWHGS
jgi:glycosyltransferase involved in cell wall biosynthesis